jgi:hypothetical protein
MCSLCTSVSRDVREVRGQWLWDHLEGAHRHLEELLLLLLLLPQTSKQEFTGLANSPGAGLGAHRALDVQALASSQARHKWRWFWPQGECCSSSAFRGTWYHRCDRPCWPHHTEQPPEAHWQHGPGLFLSHSGLHLRIYDCENVQEALKKFQDTKNKEYEKTQKQINELRGALKKHQSETENTIER